MTTRMNQIAFRAFASASLLIALAGCGSKVVPLGSTSANTQSPGTSSGTPSTSTATGVNDGITSPAVQVAAPWASARIAEGDVHSCLVDTGGAVWCWGHNSSGQLGTGNTTDAKYVTRSQTLTSGVQAIAAGGYHTCALDSSRSMWCWGANESGQLGNGTTTDSSTPVKVSNLGSGIQALALGYSHTCAIDANNLLWCWGNNAYGQLGNGTTTNATKPLAASGFTTGAKALALGYHHSCATNMDGALKCWGYNDSGRLGDGTSVNRSYPTQVQGLTSGIQAVSVGYIHTCAVDASGALWCWGSNYYGQLGTGGSTAAVLAPVAVPLNIGVQTLALGGYHSCVTDGTTVQCWGDNKYGQVGSGSNTNQLTAFPVSGTSNPIRGLAVGGFHSCVLDAVGMQCWGNNYYDQLGTGTYVDSNVAVQVYSVTPPK